MATVVGRPDASEEVMRSTHSTKRWYVFIEEAAGQVPAVSGPFRFGEASSIARVVKAPTHVVSNMGFRVPRDFGNV